MEVKVLALGTVTAVAFAALFCFLVKPMKQPGMAPKIICFGPAILIFACCATIIPWLNGTIDIVAWVGIIAAMATVFVTVYMVVANKETRKRKQTEAAAQATGNEDADPIKRA